jgi:tRNA A-37 threonylcarbamoyl transferase component Bud32
MAAFNRLIPGRNYEGRLNRGQGLEVHAFSDAAHRTHVVWTTNGLAAALPDLYGADDLAAATLLDRDGDTLSGSAALDTRHASLAVGESPLYLRWPAAIRPTLLPAAAPLPGLVIHAHGAGRHYYYRDAGWHGMVRAADGPQADRLILALRPDRIGAPARDATLRHARNAIWKVADPRDADAQLVVKQPVKHHLHKKLLDRFKPSKARRSWNGANELLRRGVDTAAPVAWFEARDGRDIRQNWYVCEYVGGQLSVGGLFVAYARGAASHAGIEAATAYARLAEYLARMHNRGIFFRDLSGGNILLRRDADGGIAFSLIDTARIRLYPGGVPPRQRLADLTRACHKLHAAGRAAFLDEYRRASGKEIGGMAGLSFRLYDVKAGLKRRLRKTAIYKQLKR